MATVQLDLVTIRNFAIALFIGALVGVEREKWKAQTTAAIAGLRTFILIAEAGAISGWLSNKLGSPWIFVVGGMAVSAVVIAGYLAQRATNPEAVGITTEVAAVVTFLLGGATLIGPPEMAVALAIVTSAFLAYKKPLHAVVEKIGEDDLVAGLKLLIATFIVLPLLPDHPVIDSEPWSALNPYRLWLLVILISALSLVGYVATRWLGTQRGTALAGLFGGMASSTAVTLAFSRRARDEKPGPALADALATGILLAWAVMAVRVFVEVAVTYPPLMSLLRPPMVLMGAAAAATAALFWWRTAEDQKKERARTHDIVPLRNPFSLTSAIRFGLLFAVILVAVHGAKLVLPVRAVYAVAALGGIPGVDAVTLSMASAVRDGAVSETVATRSIVVGALANLLVQFSIVTVVATGNLTRRLALGTAAVGVAAVLALIL